MDGLLALPARAAASISVRFRRARSARLRKRVGTLIRDLDRQGFALVSNNCVAGLLYDMASLKKQSPTAGIFFSDASFPKFLVDLAQENREAWTAIAAEALTYSDTSRCWTYAVPDGGSLVFLHYPDKDVAVKKWNDRMKRLKGRRLFIIASPRDGMTADMLKPVMPLYRDVVLASDGVAAEADKLIFDRKFLRRLIASLERSLASRQ